MSGEMDLAVTRAHYVLMPGHLISYTDGSRTGVDVSVELPECVHMPHTVSTFEFEHIGIRCRIYKRTWNWYVAVGAVSPALLRNTKGVNFERALLRAVEHVESRFYYGGRPRRDDEKFVYFVQAGVGGPVKVGFASDVRSRLSGLQVSQHEELALLGYVRGCRALERAIHAHLNHGHIRGEWFSSDLNTLLFFEELESLDRDCADLLDLVLQRSASGFKG